MLILRSLASLLTTNLGGTNQMEKHIVKHRDGTVTEWVKQKVSLEEVARRFAIWKRMIPIMTYKLPEYIKMTLTKEKHKSMTYTYLEIMNEKTGCSVRASKSNLSQYFGASIETLDENGAVFWEDESKPNYWVLADTFAI